MLPDLLHGDEKKVWGDAGYQGQTEAIREAAPNAQDMTCRRVKTKAGVDEETKAQEPNQVARQGEGGMALSHPEAGLWIYKGALSRLEEESRVAAGGLRLVNLYQHRKHLMRQLAPLGA